MSEAELRDLLAAIDANVADLMADGKLAVAKYSAGDGGPTTDRASGLKALLEARAHYQRLLDDLLGAESGDSNTTDTWELSQYVQPNFK